MTGLVFCCKTVVTERLDLLTYLLEMYELYICSEEDDEEESKKKKKKKNKDKDRSKSKTAQVKVKLSPRTRNNGLKLYKAHCNIDQSGATRGHLSPIAISP